MDNLTEEYVLEDGISLGRRLGHIEGTMRAHSAAVTNMEERFQEKIDHVEGTLDRMEISMKEKISEIDKKLDRLIEKQDKPVNWPSWIAAICTVIAMLGATIYTVTIRPLEARVEQLESKILINSERRDD